MTLPFIINPLAEADMAQAKAWYDAQRDGLGDEFLDCVEDAFDQIRKWPRTPRKVFLDLRRQLVRRFPYAVFYRVDDDQITVVAIYHGKRDPRGWQKRT